LWAAFHAITSKNLFAILPCLWTFQGFMESNPANCRDFLPSTGGRFTIQRRVFRL
jgi:hypothetical protein